MKDAKGHGSNAHGGGVQAAVPTTEAAYKGLLSDAQLSTIRAGYAGIEKIDPSLPTYGKLTALLDASGPERLAQLANANIKFVSKLAQNRLPQGNPNYNRTAVNNAIASSNRAGRKISGGEAKLIHSILKGRG